VAWSGPHRRRGAIALITAAALVAGCGGDSEPSTETTVEQPSAETVVYAIGDGADGSERSAQLAEYVTAQDPDRFFYLGDVYETGTPAEFKRNYDSLYGGLTDRTDPVIGNHEDANRREGYYPYWKAERGWTPAQAKHRSYVDDASGWQVIAYSSEGDSEAESDWIARQMAQQDGTCRIALAHRARYAIADDLHSDNPELEPEWAALAGRTAINLVGHSHVYGRLSEIDGTNVIVSGTGGHDPRQLAHQDHAVEAANARNPTAVRLVLTRGKAEVNQVDARGTVLDSTTVPCTPATGR
jgi:calcineurin-like phosphoesterase family protein